MAAQPESPEQELEWLRLICARISAFIGLLAPDGTLLYTNRTSLEDLGVSADEVIGRPFWETPWWSTEEVRRHLREAVGHAAQGRANGFEGSQPHPSGRRMVGAITFTPAGGEPERPAYVVVEGRDLTEQKQYEEALAASEAMFSGILSIAADAVVCVDEEERITFFNEGAERAFGYGREEVLGRQLELLIPHRFRERHHGYMKQFAREPVASRRMEDRGGGILGLRKNGEEFPADAAISRICVNGRTIFTAALRDISDSERLRRELTEAGAFLENILESSTEYSIIALDLEGRIQLWNAGSTRVYGYERDEVVGRSGDVLACPEELVDGRLEPLFFRALSEGKAQGKIRHRRKDGTAFLARTVVTRRNDAEGRAIGYLLISRDVSAEAKRETEQAFLAELGALVGKNLDYRDTLERISTAAARTLASLVILDVISPEGGVERVAVAHREPKMALVADRLRRMTVDPHRPHLTWSVLTTQQPLLMSALPASIVEGFAQNPEQLEILREVQPVSMLGLPLIAHGRFVGALMLVSCEPGHHFGAADLAFGEEVARRAALAVENARLFRTAQQALRARDEVLGFVAHDLRNPLNTVKLSAATLRQILGEGHPGQRAVTRIHSAADQANRFIQDLLDVTRDEAGTLNLQTAPTSPQALARDAIEEVESTARAAGINLTWTIDEETPPIVVDRDRILRVLENLLSNALKFTPSGGVVHVRVEHLGSDVVFSVSDTGPGIPLQDQRRIFQRFWQREQKDLRGAGLGLAIARTFVEEHGGRVWVDSTPGRGSTFSVSLPIRPNGSAPSGPGRPAPMH